MTAPSEPAVDTCPNGHERTKANTYVAPVTGYLKCKPCMRAQRSKKPSRAKAPKPAINPAIAAQLRAAAGIQPPRKDTTSE